MKSTTSEILLFILLYELINRAIFMPFTNNLL